MSEQTRRRRTQSPYEPNQNNNNNNIVIAELIAELLKNSNSSAAVPTVAKENKNDVINLVALFWHLLSKWIYIAGAAILAVMLALVYVTFFFTPTYSATAKLYIIADSESVINLTSLQVGSQLSDDYSEVFKTWEVHEMVRETLGLDYTYEEMQSMLSVSNSSSSRVLYITAKNKDPQLASDIANAYASSAKTFIASVMKTDEPSSFSMALVPSVPSGTGKTKIIIIAFLLGTFLSVCVIVVQFVLDDHPRTPEDITSISTLAVLGVTPTYDARDHKVYGGSHESRRD